MLSERLTHLPAQVDSALSRLKILQVYGGAGSAGFSCRLAASLFPVCSAPSAPLLQPHALHLARRFADGSVVCCRPAFCLQERITNTEHLVNLDLDAKRNALVGLVVVIAGSTAKRCCHAGLRMLRLGCHWHRTLLPRCAAAAPVVRFNVGGRLTGQPPSAICLVPAGGAGACGRPDAHVL